MYLYIPFEEMVQNIYNYFWYYFERLVPIRDSYCKKLAARERKSIESPEVEWDPKRNLAAVKFILVCIKIFLFILRQNYTMICRNIGGKAVCKKFILFCF